LAWQGRSIEEDGETTIVVFAGEAGKNPGKSGRNNLEGTRADGVNFRGANELADDKVSGETVKGEGTSGTESPVGSIASEEISRTEVQGASRNRDGATTFLDGEYGEVGSQEGSVAPGVGDGSCVADGEVESEIGIGTLAKSKDDGHRRNQPLHGGLRSGQNGV
jgi:hypothetical protein